MGATSKSFGNYIKARERAESIAKSFIEKQNLMALTKAKNEKLAEKEAKMKVAIRKDREEKTHEKQRAIKNKRDIIIKDKERDAYHSFKEDMTEATERLKNKLAKDRELS